MKKKRALGPPTEAPIDARLMALAGNGNAIETRDGGS